MIVVADVRNAYERVERHRQRQTHRLPDDLVALTFGVAGEIGDVERERGPEPDHARQGREEEGPELSGLRLAGIKRRGVGQERAEATGVAVGAPEQKETEGEEQRGLDIQEQTDRFDALV